MSTSISDDTPTVSVPRWWCSEDWLAIWLGLAILAFFSAVVYFAGGGPTEFANPLKQYLAVPSKWTTNPSSAFSAVPLVATLAAVWAIFAIGTSLRGVSLIKFTCGFLGVFSLAGLALILSSQTELKYYGLEYALWAILIGLVISNTIGTSNWLRPAMHTELYIKTGLVLLGAKVLFGVLMQLGPRGLVVAWVVTPIVLVTTYWFGQSILKIKSRTLNMVVSADMAVCGVSAAIATASACRAKKEELSLAIGISMAFTVFMMIAMPQVIKATGMNERVGGAWIGGTIDSTGAVGAAGKMVGPAAEEAAVTIKMIQNVLIGVVAFGVALYWVRFVEATPVDDRINAWEIWYRFPKFVIGFLLASFVFSAIAGWMPNGAKFVDAVVKNGSEVLRDWLFAMAFISIGLESNFRELAKYLGGGKPVVLYVCGQSLNLALTFLMAWLMFGADIVPPVPAEPIKEGNLMTLKNADNVATSFYPQLERYLNDASKRFDEIPSDRKTDLAKVAEYIRGRLSKSEPAKLIFICTHNSRRSQLSQVFAQVAAEHYGIRGIETYSGGTEATGLNPRAIAALQRCGLKIVADDPSATNPRYSVFGSDASAPQVCFSKVFNESPNPTTAYCAVMTCSQADDACPFVTGCDLRIPIRYEDPKVADDTAHEAQRYDERSAQICCEMLYLMSLVAIVH